jgi:hypothetical protein
MFKWYKNSEVCYAYLSDYTVNKNQGLDEELFKESLWFSRGWTLQELIAPAKVVFFCRDWKLIGEKTDETICNLISSTTGINAVLQKGCHGLQSEAQLGMKILPSKSSISSLPSNLLFRTCSNFLRFLLNYIVLRKEHLLIRLIL